MTLPCGKLFKNALALRRNDLLDALRRGQSCRAVLLHRKLEQPHSRLRVHAPPVIGQHRKYDVILIVRPRMDSLCATSVPL